MTTLNNITTAEFFNNLFNDALRIEFNPKWHNGTGYLNGFTRETAEAPTPVSFIMDDGRRGVGVKTPRGSLAIFERYIGDHETFTSNKPFDVKIDEPTRYKTATEMFNIIHLFGEALGYTKEEA